MACGCPSNKAGLLTLYGVGRRKLEKYGDAFLDMIREHGQKKVSDDEAG
jgi:superfamily II DNA helicase RecQ